LSKYWRAQELIVEAASGIVFRKSIGYAFRHFRKAWKVWYDVPISPNVLAKFNKLAKEAHEKNPEDVNALHMLVITKTWKLGGNCRGLVPMAKKCAALQPGVPQFHATLGLMYASMDDARNALKCIDQALELEFNAELFSCKGRLLPEHRMREKIQVGTN
jgi:hypothetical protein